MLSARAGRSYARIKRIYPTPSPTDRHHATTTADPHNALIASSSAPTPEPAPTTGPLTGLTIAIKDNIATSTPDLPRTTAASKALGEYESPFEATVITRLRSAGARINAKTNLDEFGMGSHSLHSYFGAVTTNSKRSVGGSSGGSAVAVKEGWCDAALGTDTGGSVRLPAAWCGVVGFKPSYGVVSRWGVVAYAQSLDTVGVLGREVGIVGRVFEALVGEDGKDPTSLDFGVVGRRSKREGMVRVGVPREYNVQELSPAVRRAWIKTLEGLRNQGHEIVPVSLPTTRQALSAYYVLAPAEASSNLARYDGIRYGYRSPGPSTSAVEGPLYARTRAQAFGEEVQRRILLGSYTLSASARENYFLQAQKVRRLVQNDFDRVFALPNPLLDHATEQSEGVGVDVLLTPTAPTPPPTIEAVERQGAVEGYVNDVFTVPASLAGLPAVSVPVQAEEEGVGMQVVGQFGDDWGVLRVGGMIEEMAR